MFSMIKTMLSRGVTGGAAQFRPVIRSLSSCGNGIAAGKVPWSSSTGLLKYSGVGGAGGVQAVQNRCAHDQRKKGDEELLGFLEEEIATESKNQRSPSIPTTFHDFLVGVDKSDITLTKKVGNEKIIISANVNHSVDAESGGEGGSPTNQGAKEPAAMMMRAKPNFDVEVKKGSQTLVFSCSFLPMQSEGQAAADGQTEFADLFVIDEVSFFEGNAKKTDYAVAGDILDEYLYDLFMNFLEDRGIGNELIEKFSDLCTNYEHFLYIELLTNLQKFLKK